MKTTRLAMVVSLSLAAMPCPTLLCPTMLCAAPSGAAPPAIGQQAIDPQAEVKFTVDWQRHGEWLGLDEAAMAQLQAAAERYMELARELQAGERSSSQWNNSWSTYTLLGYGSQSGNEGRIQGYALESIGLETQREVADEFYFSTMRALAPRDAWIEALCRALQRAHDKENCQRWQLRIRTNWMAGHDADLWRWVMEVHDVQALSASVAKTMVDYEQSMQVLDAELVERLLWQDVEFRQFRRIYIATEDEDAAKRLLVELTNHSADVIRRVKQMRGVQFETLSKLERQLPPELLRPFRERVWPIMHSYLNWKSYDELKQEVDAAMAGEDVSADRRERIEAAWFDAMRSIAGSLTRLDERYRACFDPETDRLSSSWSLRRLRAEHFGQEFDEPRVMRSSSAWSLRRSEVQQSWDETVNAHSATLRILLDGEGA